MENMAPWIQGSIGTVQMKYVAVTVLLVPYSLSEAEDPWRVFPNISLRDTHNCNRCQENSPEWSLFIFGIIRLVFCVMWHRVVLWKFSDHSEESCSSVFRIEGAILCVHKNCVNGGKSLFVPKYQFSVWLCKISWHTCGEIRTCHSKEQQHGMFCRSLTLTLTNGNMLWILQSHTNRVVSSHAGHTLQNEINRGPLLRV